MSLPHICRVAPDGSRGYYTWFSSMHTRVDLMYICGFSESLLNEITEDIRDELEAIEKVANCFLPDSEISILCRTAACHTVKVSPMLDELLRLCLEYNQRTLGLFDITLSPENHFKSCIGQVHLGDGMVIFDSPYIHLNMCGMLKGYALEKIRKMLAGYGIARGLVNMGNSSVLALGVRGDGQSWEVDFRPLNWPDVIDGNAVRLQDECLTTSGNETQERKHIINPQTGEYVTGHRGVAVVTDNAIEGEFLSTALFLANEEQKELLRSSFEIKRIIELK